MAGNSKGKLRILYIMRMLETETDHEHGLSMAQIIARLADLGMTVDRKTVYTDLEALREYGLRIEMFQRNPVEYAIVDRDFTLEELMLMVDAIGSCRFITQSQNDRITKGLSRLAPQRDRDKLLRRIHVDGRVRGKSATVLRNVDTIHDALRLRRKITFTYWKVGSDGHRHIQHGGKPYELTPVRVTYAQNYYYLTAWSETHEAMTEYRIDRMQNVAVSEAKAVRRAEIGDYDFFARDSQYFGRFDGPLTSVTLGMTEDMVGAVYDRFGSDARLAVENGRPTAHVSVRVSPQFFGWIAGMDGYVTIEAPRKLVQEYKDWLKKLLGE